MRKVVVTAVTIALAGCAQPGANLQANVYQAGQVNTQQEAKVINILAVLPAKVEVDNHQNQAQAETAGAVALGLGGAFLGGSLGRHGPANYLIGGAAGAVSGAAVGSLVPASVLVDGVSLTYEQNGHTLNSAQVGKMCEFKQGKAIVVSTGPGESRIQPNNECPLPKT